MNYPSLKLTVRTSQQEKIVSQPPFFSFQWLLAVSFGECISGNLPRYFCSGELPACMVGLTNIVNNVLSGAAVARGWEGVDVVATRTCELLQGGPLPDISI